MWAVTEKERGGSYDNCNIEKRRRPDAKSWRHVDF